MFLGRFARFVGRALPYGHAALPLINAYLFQYLLEGRSHVLEPPLEQCVHRISLLQALQNSLKCPQGITQPALQQLVDRSNEALQDLRVFAQGIECLLQDGVVIAEVCRQRSSTIRISSSVRW